MIKSNIALKLFAIELTYCDFIIAHNVNFDIKIVGAEFLRKNIPNLLSKPAIDTMKKTTDFCKIPNEYGFKWPKLEELYFKL